MRHTIFIYIYFLLLFIACTSDGDSNIPDIPDNPIGTKSTILSRGGSAVFIDDTGNALMLDDSGRLSGNNISFTSSKSCYGISYVTSIPLEWNSTSDVLSKGDGLVMGSRMFDGVTFTRFFVEAVDTVTGDVKLRSQSPFYGEVNNFYINPNRLVLPKSAGEVAVVIQQPTTYNVELLSGKWAILKPNTAYVLLKFVENNTGKMRTDTLVFSNGMLSDKRVPIVQMNDSID